MKRSFQTLLSFLFVFALTGQEIEMAGYQGSDIIPFAAELARISNIVYKEYPYLYDVEDDAQFYLTKYCQSEEAKLFLAYEGATVIGYAIGVPLKDYSLTFQQPFINQGLNVKEFFYIGELAILPEYRRQGIGTRLVIQMEEQVKQDQKYPKICLLHVDEDQICVKKPKEITPLASFWTHLGYTQQPNLSFDLKWKNVGELEEVSHTLIYWTKSLLKKDFEVTTYHREEIIPLLPVLYQWSLVFQQPPYSFLPQQ